MSDIIPNNEPETCPNCKAIRDTSNKYCQNCGQKNPKGIPKLWDLLGDFFSSFINLDTKFFKTIRDIFVPGKLTKKFFQGVRGQYYAPFRLLLFSSIFFFTALSYTGFYKGLKSSTTSKDYVKYSQNVKTYNLLEGMQDSIINKMADDQKEISKITFDTIKQSLSINSTDSTHFTLFGDKKYKFSKKDIVDLSDEELIEKYKVENFWSQLVVRKGFKAIKYPDKFISYLIGNIIWLLVFLIPIQALMMKLLFIRRKRYYIEHFVFLVHQHAFLFIWGSIILGAISLTSYLQIEQESASISISIGVFLLYLFFSFKTYYKQGVFKTIIKFFICGISYVILAFILSILLTLIGFAIF